MRVGVLDVESTIFAKGNPHAERNKLCLVGLRIEGKNHIFFIEYDEEPYAEKIAAIQRLVDSLDTLVLFNGKFDLNWIDHYGIKLPANLRIFDCQLAEFIVGHQRHPFPSLDYCLAKYGLGSKDPTVELEYWAHGIDTDKIPKEVIQHYLEIDLERTDDLYHVLVSLVEQGGFGQLCKLHMQDLLVLAEMERNGLLFAWDALGEEASRGENRLLEIKETILGHVPNDFRPHFNISSGDHLSRLLYGGSIAVDVGTPYQHLYKGGAKAGLTETRYKWNTLSCDFPRLVDPPEGSELKKEGYFSVDEETLLSIRHPKGEAGKTSKQLVEALLQRAELEKLCGTYFRGIPETCRKYGWTDGLVHGTFNQCRVVTGRLSSEKPNQQNFPDALMKFIVTRYP